MTMTTTQNINLPVDCVLGDGTNKLELSKTIALDGTLPGPLSKVFNE
jgi:hypothetical protein